MPKQISPQKSITLPRWQKEILDRRLREIERDPGGHLTAPQFRKLIELMKQEFERQRRAREEMDKLAAKMVDANRRAYRSKK